MSLQAFDGRDEHGAGTGDSGLEDRSLLSSARLWLGVGLIALLNSGFFALLAHLILRPSDWTVAGGVLATVFPATFLALGMFAASQSAPAMMTWME